MRKEPTLVEKIASLKCLGEIDGALQTIEREGTMTPEVLAAIATRRAELMRLQVKK